VADRYAVVGNPVEHSRSPEIHAAFAAQTGQSIAYERILAPLGRFAETVERFFASGGRGVNVTLPFKEDAFGWVDERDEFAGSAGAVNTIVRVDGRFRGCNTDGLGLVRDLERRHGLDLAGLRILILGAGGAARGVLGPLLGRSPARIELINRTAARIGALLARFEDPRLGAASASRREAFDLVINATSAGTRSEEIPFDPVLARGAFAYDMAYGAGARAFRDWAERGCAASVVDGLGMLVEQAALAFELWRGVAPETDPVLRMLRASS
jgi:shikimate dehydrogenase